MLKNNKDFILEYIRALPDEAARFIEVQKFEEIIKLINGLPKEYASKLVSSFLPFYSSKIISHLNARTLKAVLAEINIDSAMVILRAVPKDSRKKIINLAPNKNKLVYKLLFEHDEGAVGYKMRPEVFVLPLKCTIEEAIARVKSSQDSIIDSDSIFVIDGKYHIQGRVSLKKLLSAKPELVLANVLERRFEAISSKSSVFAASQHKGWKKYDTLAVVNSANKFVGIIRHADLREAIQESIISDEVLERHDFIALDLFKTLGDSLLIFLDIVLDIFRAEKIKKK